MLSKGRRIELGVGATRLGFRSVGAKGPGKTWYYVYPDGVKAPCRSGLESAERQHVKVCEGLEIESGWKRWFLVYVENCFDPPGCIVNADNEQDAVDAFVGALD